MECTKAHDTAALLSQNPDIQRSQTVWQNVRRR